MAGRTDTRKQIVEAASALFHARSYTAVGVSAVCEQAGVSKGSFFHFFESKRDLALAVIDAFQDRIGETVLTDAFSGGVAPLQRLERFVNALYAFQKAWAKQLGHVPGCPFGNIAMEQATQDEVLRQKVDGCLRAVADHLRTAVADAVASGAIEEVDVDATAEAMLAYVEGVQLLAKTRNDPELIRQLGPAITSIRVP